jgi:peptidyl-prolyl cis-trans isomerase D
MFDLVAKYKKAILIGLLVLIIPPFALFGIDSYFQGSGRASAVARVGDHEITQDELANALRERQDSLRSMSGGRIDPAMLESPEVRASVLDMLIRQRVLIDHALRTGMTVNADQLRAYITQAEVFQEDGKFSMTRYEQLLKGRNETPTSFESKVGQELLLSQLSQAYAGTSIVPRTVAERLLRITDQQREVSRVFVSPENFAAAAKLDEDAAKKYYDSHQEEFRVPEQVRVEYVTLSLDALLPQIQVDPAEVKKYYDANQRQFGVPESRQASHILIAADPSAGDEARKKARAQAEQIAAELKKNPAAFAALAKKYSQDPGSAAKGGELGSFSRGSMVKAFDDAVFGMKVGETSGPIETEYGYHIIRVTGSTPAQLRNFEQARPEIEKELKKQQAGRRYAEVADSFNNTVFEQSDSLKPAADLLKVAPRTSGWITRSSAEDPLLNNPKFLQAVFAEDVRVNKRNTEAIEIAPGTIVAARVIEHKPSAMQPFPEVKARIEKQLIQQRASQLAIQEGRQQLEQVRAGKDTQLKWDAPQVVSRTEPKGLPEPVLRQIFKADASKLPAYTGVEAPDGGFVLIKVTRVISPEKVDRAQQKSLSEGLAQVIGEEQFKSYMASLKQKADVKLNREQIEKAP